MSSRKRILTVAGSLMVIAGSLLASAQQGYSRAALGSPTIPDPISVYDNWSVYDELSRSCALGNQALASTIT
jgi:hypothetical protein